MTGIKIGSIKSHYPDCLHTTSISYLIHIFMSIIIENHKINGLQKVTASVTHAHTYIQTHTGTYTLTHAHTHSHMHIHAYTLTCLESLERSLGAWVMPLCHKVEELDYYIINNSGLKTCCGHTTTMARAHTCTHIHTHLLVSLAKLQTGHLHFSL